MARIKVYWKMKPMMKYDKFWLSRRNVMALCQTLRKSLPSDRRFREESRRSPRAFRNRD
jgi:hypothetical protein